MKHFKKISVLFILVLIAGSCITPKKIIISEVEKNPTEYLFNISMDSIRQTIEKTFPFHTQSYCNSYLSRYESWLYSKRIPNPEKNENDYLLSSGVDDKYFKCRSKVYFSKYGKPRLYRPEYYFIHLEETETGIKVYVYAIEPTLRVGWSLQVGHAIIGSWCVPRYIPVPSTTVEEYEILLMIGRTLGIEKDMPPLKIPKKIVVSSIF